MPTFSSSLNNTNKILNICIAILVLFNISLFICSNAQPITYEQTEISFHKMFWSMDGMNAYTLHSGLKKIDLPKIFMSQLIDGPFRTRQLSYFLEMATFKIGQYFGLIDIRNFMLIAIHLLNVLLFGFLIFYLTKNKFAGLLGGFILLNSGIALMTLLFPFRNAKLLVMTFFLLGWLLLEAEPKKFYQSSKSRFTAFFLILILAFFTDEYSVFLFSFLFVYIYIKDGKEGLLNKRMFKGLLGAIACCAVFSIITYHLSQKIDPTINLMIYKAHLHKLGFYFMNMPRTLKELSYAFFFYFFPRNFGYWKLSGQGSAALMASLTIFSAIVMVKHSKQTYRTIIALILIFSIKNIFLPHSNDNSYHPGVIPQGVSFPSLLFFEYYYVYCEAIFCFLIVILFLNNCLTSKKNFTFFLFLISVINCSNFVHAEESLASENIGNSQTFSKIIPIKEYVHKLHGKPLYLSFPSGNADLFKRSLRSFNPGSEKEWLNKDFEEYATSIPTYYLRSIEKGNVIISLQNAKSKKEFDSPYELVNARYFFDVPLQEFYSLDDLKKLFGVQQFEPETISRETEKKIVFPKNLNEKISLIFFVKGGSQAILRSKTIFFQEKQTYGQSYQMFQFELKKSDAESQTKLRISPIKNQHVALVGPFIM